MTITDLVTSSPIPESRPEPTVRCGSPGHTAEDHRALKLLLWTGSDDERVRHMEETAEASEVGWFVSCTCWSTFLVR